MAPTLIIMVHIGALLGVGWVKWSKFKMNIVGNKAAGEVWIERVWTFRRSRWSLPLLLLPHPSMLILITVRLHPFSKRHSFRVSLLRRLQMSGLRKLLFKYANLNFRLAISQVLVSTLPAKLLSLLLFDSPYFRGCSSPIARQNTYRAASEKHKANQPARILTSTGRNSLVLLTYNTLPETNELFS